MDKLLKSLTAKQLRGLMRYCYLTRKPMTLSVASSWVKHMSRHY